MIWHDIPQNTDEWLQLRCGKITGSGLGKIMANEGKAFGDPAKKYAIQIALERIKETWQEGGFSNHHTERGHEQEPIARMLYEETYFCDVTNGGFFDLGNIGVSPDGLVEGGGVIEIKSVIDHVQYANIKRGGLDPSYKWQFYGNLFFTGCEWLDFVSFCAEYPEGKQLFTYRIWREDCQDFFDRIQKRTEEFELLIAETMEDIQR